MSSTGHRFLTWAAIGAWLLIISILSVIKHGPESAHADIIMNSIMSLQNMTVFYWGQNRLLSVLPFVLLPFRDPETNFWMCLFFTSLSFYSLLLVTSWSSLKFIRPDTRRTDVALLFFFCSAVFLSLKSDAGATIFLLGHIEYSLSALLFLIAANVQFASPQISAIRFSIAAGLLFIAMGVNPSIIILAVFLFGAILAWQRHFNLSSLLFLVAALSSFFVWRVIAQLHGDTSPYESFSLETLRLGLPVVSDRVQTVIHPVGVMLAILTLLIASITMRQQKWPVTSDSQSKLVFISLLFAVFSVTWFVYFSGHYWVRINSFGARYFTFVFFALLALVACHAAFYLPLFGLKAKVAAGVSSVSISVLLVLSPIVPTSEFSIFRKVDSLTSTASAFYAGDYWIVWPTVLRDMMQGHDSLSLAHRAEGNGIAVNAAVRSKIASDGFFEVTCLRETEQKCLEQVEIVLGPVISSQSWHANDQLIVLRLQLPE